MTVPRYVAFLRAINVGGRVVKMDRLRALFMELDLANPETFIASGNVLFESKVKALAGLERRIETHLASALGYEVATFVRQHDSLLSLLDGHPYESHADDGHTLQIGFLKGTPGPSQLEGLKALETPTDEFHLRDRSLYWLLRMKFNETKITTAKLERVLGGPVTFRNITSIRRLVER